MILSDFLCPVHGPFEALAPSSADTAPCPECGFDSPWLPSPVSGRVVRGAVSQGKSDPPPFAHATDTRAIGEGQSVDEWKAERRKMWQSKRRDELWRKLQ